MYPFPFKMKSAFAYLLVHMEMCVSACSICVLYMNANQMEREEAAWALTWVLGFHSTVTTAVVLMIDTRSSLG